jgi:hypothetical protein
MFLHLMIVVLIDVPTSPGVAANKQILRKLDKPVRNIHALFELFLPQKAHGYCVLLNRYALNSA